MEVRTLLEVSQPRGRGRWPAFVAGLGMVLAVGVLSMAQRSDGAEQSAQTAISLLMLLALVGLTAYNYHQARARRKEQAQVEAAEELVQLRRWPQAAMALQSVLSRPAYLPMARFQALLYFTSVLSRFHRFDDVIEICDHLLQILPPTAPPVHMIKVTRGMALLRQDRLFDADRAISDLRRFPQSNESGALALLELYRDVKTGHPNEALEMFGVRRDQIARQLGHRVADAYVLAAKAHDLLGHTDAAQAAYEAATLLAPAGELRRRYPEIADLAAKYRQTEAPAEVLA